MAVWAFIKELIGPVFEMLKAGFFYRAGGNKEKLKQKESEIEDITEANKTHDRLKSDSGFAGRVRKRFTRR